MTWPPGGGPALAIEPELLDYRSGRVCPVENLGMGPSWGRRGDRVETNFVPKRRDRRTKGRDCMRWTAGLNRQIGHNLDHAHERFMLFPLPWPTRQGVFRAAMWDESVQLTRKPLSVRKR